MSKGEVTTADLIEHEAKMLCYMLERCPLPGEDTRYRTIAQSVLLLLKLVGAEHRGGNNG